MQSPALAGFTPRWRQGIGGYQAAHLRSPDSDLLLLH